MEQAKHEIDVLIENVKRLSEQLDDALARAIQVCGNTKGGMEFLCYNFCRNPDIDIGVDITSKEDGIVCRFSSWTFYDAEGKRISKEKRRELNKNNVWERHVG